MTMEKHVVEQTNAALIWSWLQERGGIIVWQSHDLSNPGRSVTTPARTADGNPVTSPGWRYPEPTRHITDPADVVVTLERVLETVPIKVRMGSQGMSLKVTDASARKMDRKVANHQKRQANPVWWEPTGDLFDHSAVIVTEDKRQPIAEFMTA
jgi:hypothetical protein